MPHARLQRLRREGTRGAARGATGGGRRGHGTPHTRTRTRTHSTAMLTHHPRHAQRTPERAHFTRSRLKGREEVSEQRGVRATRGPSDNGAVLHSTRSMQRGPYSGVHAAGHARAIPLCTPAHECAPARSRRWEVAAATRARRGSAMGGRPRGGRGPSDEGHLEYARNGGGRNGDGKDGGDGGRQAGGRLNGDDQGEDRGDGGGHKKLSLPRKGTKREVSDCQAGEARRAAGFAADVALAGGAGVRIRPAGSRGSVQLVMFLTRGCRCGGMRSR